MPKQGEIVLIPVPFTNLTSNKRRPVIIISNDEYNQTTADMVVTAMTSTPARGPYSFTITTEDLAQGALNRPGTVRMDKIYTLDQSLIVKTCGQVNNLTLARVQAILRSLTTRRSNAANQ